MRFPPYAPAGTALAAVLTAGGLATLPGCSGDRSEPAPPQARAAVDICVDLVAYWVKEALTGSRWAGLDWEQKGLSNEQLKIHDEVLASARERERTEGRRAALAFTDEAARRRCVSADGATGSSENWKPLRSLPPPEPSVTLRDICEGAGRSGALSALSAEIWVGVRYPETVASGPTGARSAQAP
ncbi:hypothetical protein M5362_18500 [Streptomyces sp. Je 1-79]|uniref:hypothetical protein n=1 Tax=Streptomyces sp. Je 1-79 TaxID=2943847 RepID=UPI0021A80917|nr:hypothetical protein [Streptomyces sp. Je 1-79]MCT4355125.1 hypothetical protein [Streptomyces sp. Je 1-79]